MKITALLASTALLVAPAAFADDCAWSKAKQSTANYEQSEARYIGHHGEKADIVETAKAAGSFNTLLAAADAAGLVGALQGDGPLTVFAPTDAAFAALPEGTVESLLLPENKDALAGILKLHVISGKVKAADLAGSVSVADTLNGSVTVDGTNGVSVAAPGSTATVVTADVMASNGVIHVIDTVLLPAG